MANLINTGFVYLTVVNVFLITAFYFLYVEKNQVAEFQDYNSHRHPRITVQSEVGKIVGFNQKRNGRMVDTFLGIPYAEPPIDSLRFKAPKLKFTETNEINALDWPANCIQPDNKLQLWNRTFSEDCLYLNIWTPSANSTKPVLVVIHTGAFVFGSSTEATYDGLELASRADVVVVTFNYRLNFYGFLYTNTDSVTPNVGMLDQVAALQWVNTHIASFNGDPLRVTLVGQSSGALSVGMHITSPLSRGLFSQAILMSGSPLQVARLNQPKEVLSFWKNFADQLGCLGGDLDSMSNTTIECLHSQLEKDRNLMPTMEMVKQLSSDPLFVNIPIVVDGSFQPKNQINLINDLKNANNNLSIIFGFTTDEGSWIAMIEDKADFGTKIQPTTSRADSEAAISKFIQRIYSSHPINDSEIIDHYVNNIGNIQRQHLSERAEEKFDEKESIVWNRLATSILGDYYIICPQTLFAERLLDSMKNVSIYQYYWNYKGNPRTSSFWNTFSHVWCGPWMGTCHGFEMYAIFGIPFIERGAFSNEDRIVSAKAIQMIKYFTHNRKLFWPKFKTEVSARNLRMFYVIDQYLDQFQLGDSLKIDVCRKVWEKYLVEI